MSEGAATDVDMGSVESITYLVSWVAMSDVDNSCCYDRERNNMTKS